MVEQSGWARLIGPHCLLSAPASLGLYPHVSPAPDSDLTALAKATGYAGGVPVVTLVSTRSRSRTLRAELASTIASLDTVVRVPDGMPGAVEIADAILATIEVTPTG